MPRKITVRRLYLPYKFLPPFVTKDSDGQESNMSFQRIQESTLVVINSYKKRFLDVIPCCFPRHPCYLVTMPQTLAYFNQFDHNARVNVRIGCHAEMHVLRGLADANSSFLRAWLLQCCPLYLSVLYNFSLLQRYPLCFPIIAITALTLNLTLFIRWYYSPTYRHSNYMYNSHFVLINMDSVFLCVLYVCL